MARSERDVEWADPRASVVCDIAHAPALPIRARRPPYAIAPLAGVTAGSIGNAAAADVDVAVGIEIGFSKPAKSP